MLKACAARYIRYERVRGKAAEDWPSANTCLRFFDDSPIASMQCRLDRDRGILREPHVGWYMIHLPYSALATRIEAFVELRR